MDILASMKYQQVGSLFKIITKVDKMGKEDMGSHHRKVEKDWKKKLTLTEKLEKKVQKKSKKRPQKTLEKVQIP